MTTKKYLFIVSISAILFFIFIWFFIFLYENINSNNTISEELEIEWQTEVKRLNEVRLLNRSIDKIKKEKYSLESHFVKNTNIVPFLDSLEKLASLVSVKNEILSVNVPSNDTSLVINLKMEGDFNSIYKFLMLLENSSYEITINSFNVTRSLNQGEKDLKKWTADFKISLLSFNI